MGDSAGAKAPSHAGCRRCGFAFRLRGLPDPTEAARVVAVWEGVRRTHSAPPEQATPLMPPELLDVLEACPATRTWRTPGRASEPDLAGARDKALLLAGFTAALRRSELVALDRARQRAPQGGPRCHVPGGPWHHLPPGKALAFRPLPYCSPAFGWSVGFVSGSPSPVST